VDQVFAAGGRHRARAWRAALALAAGLLALWVVALAFGALGGFNSLPSLDLGSSQPEGTAAPAAKPQSVTPSATLSEPKVAAEQDAISEAPTTQGEPAPRHRTGQAPGGASQPAPPPAPATTVPVAPTASVPGKAVGEGAVDGTGKPAYTPGQGGDGSNGRAVGKAQ
jgi:hypothetical protein